MPLYSLWRYQFPFLCLLRMVSQLNWKWKVSLFHFADWELRLQPTWHFSKTRSLSYLGRRTLLKVSISLRRMAECRGIGAYVSPFHLVIWVLSCLVWFCLCCCLFLVGFCWVGLYSGFSYGFAKSQLELLVSLVHRRLDDHQSFGERTAAAQKKDKITVFFYDSSLIVYSSIFIFSIWQYRLLRDSLANFIYHSVIVIHELDVGLNTVESDSNRSSDAVSTYVLCFNSFGPPTTSHSSPRRSSDSIWWPSIDDSCWLTFYDLMWQLSYQQKKLSAFIFHPVLEE